jgi:hypothetical protein
MLKHGLDYYLNEVIMSCVNDSLLLTDTTLTDFVVLLNTARTVYRLIEGCPPRSHMFKLHMI